MVPANPDTLVLLCTSAFPMHLGYLGTVLATRYIQSEDDRLVPQFI